jgi:hypothetical protein
LVFVVAFVMTTIMNLPANFAASMSRRMDVRIAQAVAKDPYKAREIAGSHTLGRHGHYIGSRPSPTDRTAMGSIVGAGWLWSTAKKHDWSASVLGGAEVNVRH